MRLLDGRGLVGVDRTRTKYMGLILGIAPSEDCAISSLPSRSNILSATVEGFVDAEYVNGDSLTDRWTKSSR